LATHCPEQNGGLAATRPKLGNLREMSGILAGKLVFGLSIAGIEYNCHKWLADNGLWHLIEHDAAIRGKNC
jgi:hypothetical protein